jgi:hypothetical protein
MSAEGIRLIPPNVGSGLVLTGFSRMDQKAKEKAEELLRLRDIEQKQGRSKENEVRWMRRLKL